MPRRARMIEGGYVYHVLNRANACAPLFQKDADYAAFERVLEEAHEREPLRILNDCIMPNHWHMIVWPSVGAGQQVSEFLRWLTVTHSQRWHAHHGTSGTGHLYQGRFKSFPVESDEHFYTVARYVERNGRRANLVDRADAWRWCSLWRWLHGDADSRRLLSDWPVTRPSDWVQHVQTALTKQELDAVRRCVQRGQPYGSNAWCAAAIKELGLEHTIRARGRPKKGDGSRFPVRRV